MPIFLLMVNQLQSISATEGFSVSKKVRAAAAVGLAALTFVRPPPQGFKVSDLSAGAVSHSRFEAFGGVVRPWLGQMFFVMFSGAILGLAQLVYTHFMKKWEQQGLPVLPINVLRPGHQGQPGQPAWAPGGTAYPGQPVQPGQARPMPAQAGAAPQQAQAKAGSIDEYRD